MKSWLKYYAKRPVLVTGGAGFIGSRLTKMLVNAGAYVTILDNFSTGSITALEPIAHKLKIIVGDITNQTLCMRAAMGKTHIFHLAAAISVAESMHNPEKYMQINVMGTENLLKAARSEHVQRFIFSSSAAVYGNQTIACSETTPPVPLSPYAQSKLRGEELCKQYSSPPTFEAITLRYFNVFDETFSATSTYAAAIPIFIEKIRRNAPITLFGDGQQTRDFVPVEEIVNANLMAGCAPTPVQPIINVASGKSKTLLSLIDELVKQLGKNHPSIIFAPPRPGDIIHSKAQCDRYTQLKEIVKASYGPS